MFEKMWILKFVAKIILENIKREFGKVREYKVN